MSGYNDLKKDLKKVLNQFRLKLLFLNLLKGIVLLSLYTVVYLFLYYCISSFFLLSITTKTLFYFFFLGGLFFLFFFFLVRPVVWYIIASDFKKDFLLKQIDSYVAEPEDNFYSLFYLAFRSDQVAGNDEDLKKAAFVQKYQRQQTTGNFLNFPYRYLWRTVLFLFLLTGIGFVNISSFTAWYKGLANYQELSKPGFNVNFRLLNTTLNAEYGKPFQLLLKVESDFLSVDNVFVCYSGGEFLMNKKDSVFVYDFDMVNNDLKFRFKTNEVESKWFKISVLSAPVITDYRVTLVPPVYTGLKTEVFENTLDFRVLYGSVLHFEIGFSATDSVFLQSGQELTDLSEKITRSGLKFSRTVKTSGEYTLLASNSDFFRKDLLNFTVTCLPDLYPGIQVSEITDSLNTALHYFYGVITDDYGFSDLRFSYSLNGQRNTVIPIDVRKNVNTQDFYFEFNFAEFAGMDRAKLHYFFEVFDNDNLSGPKSTRSDDKTYAVPDLNEIFDYNSTVNTEVNSSLNEAEKLAQEIVTGVKELQKKILDNSSDNWEKQQLAKDIVEKKEKLDKLLQEVKEKNIKKTSFNNSFSKQDSILKVKQEKIQELLDKIMDEDMRKLMEEFQKLSEEFSKDKFQRLDEKMKLGFDQLSEELDRNIELLKRYQIEEQHGNISEQLEQLKKLQDEFQESLVNRKSVSSDSLAKMGEEIQDKFQNITDNYKKLKEENEQLTAPFSLEPLEKDFNELSQNIEKQKKSAAQGKKDKKLSHEVKKQMDRLSDKMQQQQQQNFMKPTLPQKDIELIIQNILLISFSQEDLIQQFRGVSTQSSRYHELGRMQDMKKLEYRIVKDSLSALARSNLTLASLLNNKFYDIERKFSLLPDYIQNNKRGELAREQQYIVNYLNDMALVLTEALQKSEDEGEAGGAEGGGKKGNKGKNDKNGKGDKEQGYGNLKKFQNGLKRQMEQLVQQMRKGEKGKPLQEGISKMIRENELFQKSLNEFMSESGSLSNAEKQLLNEINKLLEDNIKDIANYSISNNLIQRNNLIYNKLLMSEKASKEREEYEEKRKSVTAQETKFSRPEIYFNAGKKTGLMKTDFQKSGVQLNPYFKNMYNNYYIKLGDE